MTAPIDLRSDTVTKPTQPMRQAMAAAAVGDDCYGDDPTVLALEQRVAALLGKDGAVFLPTGTMANQLAVRMHCPRGVAMATHPGAHVRIHEDASAAAVSGVQVMPIGERRGFDVAALADLCAQEEVGWPRVALCWVENTLGDAGGLPWGHDGSAGVDPVPQIAAFCNAHDRPIHLDGARLWNAHIATGLELDELASAVDTVSVSMSKGLGAPMGSLLAGNAPFVERARASKHAMGGGMRQAGIVAAAGLYALDHHIGRIALDHARAQKLADAIADLPCWSVRPPVTNIVIARVAPELKDAEVLCKPLRDAGVLCYPNIMSEVRFALHLGIDDDALTDAIDRIRETLK